MCELNYETLNPAFSLKYFLHSFDKILGRSTSIKGGKYSDLEDEIQGLKNNSQNVNKTLVSCLLTL